YGDARRIHREHSRQSWLGARTGVDGVAGQVGARDLSADPGSRSKRRVTVDKLRQHVTSDPVVAWGFQPGEGRIPAPGTQAQLGSLIDAWIATGAQCPQR